MIRRCLEWFAARRAPDFVIGGQDGVPYMRRWWLVPRNRWMNAYLHQVSRDDDDRALHDHPWANVSIVLAGAYREVMPDWQRATTPHQRVWDVPARTVVRQAGSVVLRRATAAHRLEVHDGPVWTLFLTWRKVRVWGFHCQWGWRPWYEFVSKADPGATGAGCDDGPADAFADARAVAAVERKLVQGRD